MSSFGTMMAAMASLKNNKRLRKGHSYFDKNKQIKRSTKGGKVETYHRTEVALKELRMRYELRYQSIHRKRKLFLIAIAILAFSCLLFLLN